MLRITSFLTVFFWLYPAVAATPNLTLETRIAYQQGQFAALYDQCGSVQQKTVIGGSTAQWRTESFEGYMGSAAERQQLELAFATALAEVKADPNACKDWTKQAAAVWRSIARLTMYGTPVAFKP